MTFIQQFLENSFDSVEMHKIERKTINENAILKNDLIKKTFLLRDNFSKSCTLGAGEWYKLS